MKRITIFSILMLLVAFTAQAQNVTKTYDNGDKYVGQMKDGKRNGQGTMTYANGDKYVGQWNDDQRNGQGTMTYANGNKYVGEFRDDVRDGQGTMTYASGSKYVGEWKDGKENGQGTMTYTNGNKYVGQWRNGDRNGQGTYTWPNGDKYVGEFRDDKIEGKGTMTYAGGRVENGYWKDDKLLENTINGHEWVDLGLSVKWATCNVGASTPSDYGGYYAWAETSSKSKYFYSNCFDCIDGIGDYWRIYKKNGQTRIDPSSGHDAARENWGGTWRMPTEAEFNELCNKCKWTWTSINGHNGYRITGPNGNSIFLPAAGLRGASTIIDVGTEGTYWSSTLSAYKDGEARDLDFCSDKYFISAPDRCWGLSIRPVTE